MPDMGLARLGSVVLLALGLVHCSSGSGNASGSGGGSGSGACSGACSHMADCGASTQSECLSLCSAFSSACLDAIQAASCTELKSSNSPVETVCFPPCTGSQVTCSGNTASGCSNGHQVAIDCSGACTSKGLTYSGVCGPSYQGKTCANGSSCCWCV